MKHRNFTYFFLALCTALITPWQFASADLVGEDPTTLTITKEQNNGVMGFFSSILDSNKEPFLPPERAFIFSAEALNANTLSASWEIADGYYLYRDKFSFTLKESPGITLGQPSIPRGEQKEDANFGTMEVFFDEVETRIPLTRNSTEATDITLIVGYQGCAKAGFCYPPIKQEVVLSLPKTGVNLDSPQPATSIQYLSDQDRYAHSLAEDNFMLSMLSFFGLGLLLTFTPCVFPMIPILSSIIAGQGSSITTRKAFWLSLIYVLAMAATYTTAGIIAGLFGSNLQAAFQNPWILGSFSALFVILALSMFGFYELQMPQKLQTKLAELSNKQQGGTFIGVAVMGLLSALIVGPCLAAPLAGALIYIGQTGDAVLGGSALFALSLGMGAPLLFIGTSAGKLLPKAGPWMNTIKSVFGVLLLAVAIWLLERIIPAPVTLALWGILLIVSAVFLGALERLQPEANGWKKLWKGLGLALLIYGGMLLIGASTGGNDMFRPLANLSIANSNSINNETHALTFKPIKGIEGLERELQLAKTQNKTVMLDFYADWCISCKEMEKLTFSKPGVQTALRDTVLLQADVTLNDAQDQKLLKTFGLFGPPSILFFNTQGQELPKYRLVGFLDAERFETHVKAILKSEL